MIASGASDNTVRLWSPDGTSGPLLEGHTDRIGGNSLAWNPDGSRLASGSWDWTVRLWNRDGSAGPVLLGDAGRIASLSWSPDGKRLASGTEENTILVRDADSGDPEWSAVFLPENNKAVFSGGGKLLHGDPEVVEKELVYIVEHFDGRRETLKPSEFRKRIIAPLTGSESDPDRSAALWVLENHGWVQVLVDGKASPQSVKAGESLPDQQYTLFGAHLDEQATSVTNEDMKRFAGLEKLNWLNLNGIPISDDGIQYLSKCESLETLNLSATHVTDKALQFLKEMPRLKGLTLNGTRMTESAITALEEFPVLEAVGLGQRILTSTGRPMVSRLKNLRRLSIHFSDFSDADLPHLKSLKQLQNLRLHGTSVTAAGATELSKSLPLCRISYGDFASPTIIEPSVPDPGTSQ
jgi:dipeptidyl aminopeptidase/acylaminoacyl peptidase